MARVLLGPAFGSPAVRPIGSAIVLATLLVCEACTGSFGAGVRDFDHGRYPEALDELRVVECDAQAWSPRDRARYALYRGLTHLALGARPAAVRWLSEAKRAMENDPLLLSSEDAGRLASAWSHLPAE
jgi:hypothetical protein